MSQGVSAQVDQFTRELLNNLEKMLGGLTPEQRDEIQQKLEVFKEVWKQHINSDPYKVRDMKFDLMAWFASFETEHRRRD